MEKMGTEWGLQGWVIGVERHLREGKCTEVGELGKVQQEGE